MATYYVAKIGSQWKYRADAWPDVSNGTNASNLRNAVALCGAGNTVIIAAGEYSSTTDLTTGGMAFVTANQTIRAPLPGDDQYPLYAGKIIFSGINLPTAFPLSISGAGTIVNDCDVKDCTPGYANVAISANCTVNKMKAYGFPSSGSDSGGFLCTTAGVVATLNDCVVDGNGKTSTGNAFEFQSAGGTLSLNRCKATGCKRGLLLRAGAVVDKNCLYNGSVVASVGTTGSVAVVYTSNNTFFGTYALASTNAYNIQNDSTSSTITINNPVALYCPFNRNRRLPSGITVNNLVAQCGPRFVSPHRVGILTVVFDDAYSADEVEVVAAKFDAYGYKLTWAVNTAQMDAGKWAMAADLLARGHDIASHSRSHSTMTAIPDAQLVEETVGSLSDIATNLDGHVARAFVYPGTVGAVGTTAADLNCRAFIHAAGFSCARGGNGLAAIGLHMNSIAAYRTWGDTPGTLFFGALGTQADNPTEAEIRGRVASFCEMLAFRGSVGTVYGHAGPGPNIAPVLDFPYDFTHAQWDWFLDEVSKANVRVMLYADAMEYVFANATSTSGAGGEIAYLRTDASLGDDSNYHLLPTSPCIGAGVDVGLTTDADGAVVPGAVGYDIGPYSYMPGWTMFDGSMPPLSLAATAPCKLLEVQEWTRSDVTKKQIDKVSP